MVAARNLEHVGTNACFFVGGASHGYGPVQAAGRMALTFLGFHFSVVSETNERSSYERTYHLLCSPQDRVYIPLTIEHDANTFRLVLAMIEHRLLAAHMSWQHACPRDQALSFEDGSKNC